MDWGFLKEISLLILVGMVIKDVSKILKYTKENNAILIELLGEHFKNKDD